MIARILGLVTLFLIIASISGQVLKFVFGHDYVHGLVQLFYVDLEENIPTFYSVLLLLLAALLLALLAVLHARMPGRHALGWTVLSIGFIFMAYDEASSVHEKLIEPMRDLLGDRLAGPLYFAWVIPGILLVLLLGLFFLKFLRQLPSRSRRNFLVAAALYLGGAIGVEMAGGYYAELYGMKDLTYGMIATVEEGLEMTGLVVFLWALLDHLADNHPEIRLQIVKKAKNTPGTNPHPET